MDKKIFQIFIIFLMLIAAFCLHEKQEKLPEYKIIEIVGADRFYLDLNNNNKTDENELVKLKYVRAFSPIKSDFSEKTANNLNISTLDYLKLGVLATNWAKSELLGKNVKVKGLSNCDFLNNSCYVEIKFDKGDLAKYLLLNGLGYIRCENKRASFYSYFNFSQVKKNLKAIDLLDFVIVNLKNGIVHNVNCEYASKITHGRLELKNKLTNSRLCNFCKDFNKINFTIAKSKMIYSKSVSKKSDNIELYFINPLQNKKPNNSCNSTVCKRLLKEIDNSKKSIDIALYGIGEQKEILTALKNAKNRGVEIRSVVDFSLKENGYSKTQEFIKEFNSVVDNTESLMHNKFFIFDKKLIMSGSANISSTGIGEYNSNIVLFSNDKNTVEAFIDEFEQMHAGYFSKKKEKKDVIFSSKIQAYFSPQDDILNNVVIPNLKNAKKKIYISAFYLTEQKLIQELINSKKRGVEVLVLMDAVGASNFKNKISLLRESLIPVIVEDWGGKNHEKTIMIDDEVLIIGSCNFSKSGFYKNDENMIVIKDKNLASFYTDYFLFLFDSINKKFLHIFPSAEGKDSRNSCFDGIDNDFDGLIDIEEKACK